MTRLYIYIILFIHIISGRSVHLVNVARYIRSNYDVRNIIIFRILFLLFIEMRMKVSFFHIFYIYTIAIKPFHGEL